MLTAAPVDPAARQVTGAESRRILKAGDPIGWTLSSPRRCIGIWDRGMDGHGGGGHRRCCPHTAVINSSGPDAQCPACASTDRGRAIARDSRVTDERTFVLYLAWFGTGLTKIGLTAAEREHDRLLEQAAAAFTLLARGPYAAIRRAEQAIATTGLATERISARAKADAWWTLPSLPERAQQVEAAASAIQAAAREAGASWLRTLELLPVRVVDQVAVFCLPEPFPPSYNELRAVGDGAVLAGRIAAIIGRRLLLDTATGPLLADMRLLTGRPFTPNPTTSEPPIPTGLDTVRRDRPGAHHDDTPAGQESLF